MVSPSVLPEFKKGYDAVWFDHGVCVLHISLNDHGFHHRDVKKFCGGMMFDPSIMEITRDSLNWYVQVADFDEVGRRSLAKMRGDKHFVKWLEENTLATGAELRRACEKVKERNEKADGGLAKAGNGELAEFYEKIFRGYIDICYYGIYVMIAEVHNLYLTKALQQLVRHKTRELGFPGLEQDYFDVLTFPKKETETAEMKRSAFQIAALAAADEKAGAALKKNDLREAERALANSRTLDKLVENHVSRYCWVNYGYGGPALTRASFVEEIAAIVRGSNPEAELKTLERRQSEIEEKRAAFTKQLNLTDDEAHLLKVGATASFLKTYRKELMSFACFALDLLSAETAKRFGLALGAVRACTKDEIPAMLRGGADAVPDKAKLKERQEYCGYVTVDEDAYEILYGDDVRSLIKRVAVKTEAVSDEVKIIKGHTACKGFVRGFVKVINTVSDMYKMDHKNVLVSVQTNPELVPVMKKAAAIVTDLGGITCHAAIVSRELGVPCVIGTRIATKVLHDGDLVEVDATNATVKKL